MKRIGLFPFSAVLLVVSGFTPAQAETVACTAITSLPYTISTQGVYCLTGHLNTGITSGNAITIATNNVVLDLNGFKIGGLAAGKATMAVGIYASQRQNITIKNGTVRGFFYGILLEDWPPPFTISQGHVIEDIRADLNTVAGMAIYGNGNTIRNNQVVATGGSTADGGADVNAFGIQTYGLGARLLNNDVTDVAAQGTGSTIGLTLSAASNTVVAGNRVSNLTSPSGIVYGILVQDSPGTLIRDNSLTGMQNGIYFVSGTGKYMNNMTMDVTTPYTGGTPAGTTNY